MKTFIVHYSSECNLFKGSRVIRSNELSEAQNKFLDWLKTQSVYSHLWKLKFEFDEIREIT